MKNNKKVPVVPENPKRAIAKFKRGKGQKAIEAMGVDEKTYAQSKDPFFKVKGKERHERMKLVR